MYSEENYIWGLIAYGLGVILVLPAMIKVTGFIMPWKPLRILLRLFFIALLITPVYANQDVKFLAPAWIVAAFETLSPTSPEGPAFAYAALTGMFAGLSVLTALFYVIKHFWHKHKKVAASGSAQPRQKSEPQF